MSVDTRGQTAKLSAITRAEGRVPARVCLLTTMQPSTNPRLVKEADALAEAGFDVIVFYAYMTEWATQSDVELLASRPWKSTRVGGHPHQQNLRFFYTRLRYRASRELLGRVPKRLVPWNWVLSRVSSELTQAARRTPADLYIAHNLGALPAAIAGARRHGAHIGFDAEDFHSDMVGQAEMTPVDALAEDVESDRLPCCHYVTAAAPAMAQAYARKYGIAEPVPILNVFPLAARPSTFRPSNPSGPLTLYWFSQTIGHGRGIEDAVRAMGMLGSRDVELYLQGVWESGYRETLETLSASVGLGCTQLIHLPPEPPASLIRHASTYDVGLALEQANSKNNDLTVSNKMFTYILAGNAVAATSTAGQKPIIDRIAPGGCCYAPGNVDGLAACLDRWQRDRRSLDAARRASWEWGTREYNWEIEKHKFLSVVNRVLTKTASYAGSPA